MKENYHTHTWRCMHARGTEREYVESAIEGGLEVLGFSDHTPYPYPDGYVSGMRMRVDQLEDYVDTVLALKAQYRDDIEIHLGLEVEYYTDYFPQLQRLVADYPVEYFLLAQHCVGCEIGGVWSGAPTDDEAALHRYCLETAAAMETGYFTYFAHPDLFRFTGSDEIYTREMRALCRQAKKLAMPLEINFLGLYEGRHYPDQRFWKIAGEEKCDAVFGVDAHCPEVLRRSQEYEEARKLVRRYGLHLIETVELRPPVRRK